MQNFPVIDIGRCSRCEGCASIAPKIFSLNKNTGHMGVTSLCHYPQKLVDEAIKNCPKDCISWDEPILYTTRQ